MGVMMMMPFNFSYRNKNEPTAIYPYRCHKTWITLVIF